MSQLQKSLRRYCHLDLFMEHLCMLKGQCVPKDSFQEHSCERVGFGRVDVVKAYVFIELGPTYSKVRDC